jgi:hypothetical protein
MAQDLFGAPLGFIAAAEQANKTAMTQVQAQKILGEIEQMPAETELKRAQARHHDAQAGKIALDANGSAVNDAWFAAAQKALRVVPATQGRAADAGDVDLFRPQKVADPLRRMYDFMVDNDAPASVLLPLAKQVSDITQNESIGAYREGQAKNEQMKAREKVADLVGSYAKAAMASPEGYAQVKMLTTQMGKQFPPVMKQYLDSLPQDWETGKGKLQVLIDQSLAVKDKIAIEQKEQELELKKTQEVATTARNEATAKLAEARTKLLEDRAAAIEKEGGEKAAAALEAQKALTAQRAQKMKADQLKTNPYAPLPGTDPVPGKVYTAKDGRLVRAGVKPDGTIGYQVMPGTKPWE